MRSKWLISWIFTFPLFKLLTGVEIRGSVAKKGAVILASNHTSFLDPPLIGYCAFREVYFLAKAGLFAVSRFFTWLITGYNAIAISDTSGLRNAVKLLREGNAVVIFPEGTRSKNGVLLPFNPGVGYLSISYGIPVVPVYITNSNKQFITLLLRLNNLRIRFGKPIYPTGYQKNREDFEKFTERVRDEVLNLKFAA